MLLPESLSSAQESCEYPWIAPTVKHREHQERPFTRVRKRSENPAEREIAAGRDVKIGANLAKLRERNQRAKRSMDFPEYAVGGFRII